MRYAIPGRSDITYAVGETVKLYNGTLGEVTQRHSNSRRVTLKLYDGTTIEAPEHYIVGVKYP